MIRERERQSASVPVHILTSSFAFFLFNSSRLLEAEVEENRKGKATSVLCVTLRKTFMRHHSTTIGRATSGNC